MRKFIHELSKYCWIVIVVAAILFVIAGVLVIKVLFF